MELALIAGAFTLIGTALGGGLQFFQHRYLRKAEADATLSALVAEVDALTRLVNHRQFLPEMIRQAQGCQNLMEAGHEDAPVAGIRVSMAQDYFSLYNALAAKIGTLDPYKADRIVRFYALAKAASESLLDAELAEPMPAVQRLLHLENDIQILSVMLTIGCEVAGFREAKGPAAALGPLTVNMPPYRFKLLPPPPAAGDNAK